MLSSAPFARLQLVAESGDRRSYGVTQRQHFLQGRLLNLSKGSGLVSRTAFVCTSWFVFLSQAREGKEFQLAEGVLE